MQVAFYGGSFNPPHVAHVLAVVYLLSAQGFQRVLVVPVFEHAFEKPLAGFEHRVRMCELAMGWLPGVQVSAVEAELERPTRTLHTLEHLSRQHPDWALRLVVGADQLPELHRWHQVDAIEAMAPILVLGRASVDRPEAPPALLPNVSSTHVRELLLSRGQAEADSELGRLVPQNVLRYIDQHGLYR
ncbi:MAG TPA: nicotinate (nicotinamide) nucleotide adenylyltransferase [Polyangiaceae bacterium]|jgi:nicotinate-nucleotide adenylyltransferase